MRYWFATVNTVKNGADGGNHSNGVDALAQ